MHTEGVSLSAGEIVIIAGRRRDEDLGGQSGLPWWVGVAIRKKKYQSYLLPSQGHPYVEKLF